MLRPLFCALGIAALILGSEFLVINRATLTIPADSSLEGRPFLQSMHETTHTKEFVPPEWAPWTLLSVGAVLVLYSTTVVRE